MRSAAAKFAARRLSARSLGYRCIPAALAIVGFLMTFTIRGWQEGLWLPDPAVDHAIVSAPQQGATARRSAKLESPLPLESVLRQEAVRLRAAPMPNAPSAVVSADAQHYLAERDREESHDGRLR
jgi:hypothetical protein